MAQGKAKVGSLAYDKMILARWKGQLETRKASGGNSKKANSVPIPRLKKYIREVQERMAAKQKKGA